MPWKMDSQDKAEPPERTTRASEISPLLLLGAFLQIWADVEPFELLLDWRVVQVYLVPVSAEDSVVAFVLQTTSQAAEASMICNEV